MPTSRANDGRPHRAAGGFALIDLTLALAVLALIAVLALPRPRGDGGGLMARLAAYRIAALVRGDRTAADRLGRTVAPVVDAGRRRVVSGARAEAVDIPAGVNFGLAAGGNPAFSPGGATGGLLAVGVYGVRVDGYTGAVSVTGRRP